jgi:hypothetical protein
MFVAQEDVTVTSQSHTGFDNSCFSVKDCRTRMIHRQCSKMQHSHI